MSEGQDMPDLTLETPDCTLIACVAVPYNQDALIQAVAAANPHTIVVLNTGAPVVMPWLDQVKGVLEAWYPGQQDGNAIAALLFGDVDPSGKLPITFPRSEKDLPTRTPQQYPGVNGHAVYTEGLDVGYRWYDNAGIQPLFPFGHGLSYTTFAYSRLAVSPAPSGGTATATFDVTNTGHRAGAEVAQLYVGAPPDNYAREPVRQLRGYQRVALQPGQTAHVTIPIDSRAVSYWSTASHAWTAETGCHAVFVGSSSRDLRLQAPGLDGSLQVCGASASQAAAVAAAGTIRLPNTAIASDATLSESAIVAGAGLGLAVIGRRRRGRASSVNRR
jgi:beta-glucosidase